MVVRKNGKRNAILTEQNRLHLNSLNVSPKILHGIKQDLDKRIDELGTDLKIIKKSNHLESWRSTNFARLQELQHILSEMSFSFKPIYVGLVQRYKKQIGKKNLFVYWMDSPKESHLSNDKIFDPSFALRKIKSRMSVYSINVITKAVELNLVPIFKENAKSVMDFNDAFNDEEKFSNLQTSVNSPGKTIIVKLKSEIEEARQQEKEIWKFANHEFDKLDKKLIKKFGCTVERRINLPQRDFDY